jgi:hypothetical protein
MYVHPIISEEFVRLHLLDLERDAARVRFPSSRRARPLARLFARRRRSDGEPARLDCRLGLADNRESDAAAV